MKKNIFLILFTIFTSFIHSQPDSRFRPFDWVLYHGSGVINSISEGYNYLYVGTEKGGLQRLNTFTMNFDEPITMAQGLKSNNVRAVHFDKETGFLWVATPDFLHYSFSREGNWFSINLESLGLGKYDLIKKIGSSIGYIWLELNSSYAKLDHTNGFLISVFSQPDELSIIWSSGLKFVDSKIKQTLLDFSYSDGWLFLNNGFVDKLGRRIDLSTYYYARHGNIFIGLENGAFFVGTDFMQEFRPLDFYINNYDISALEVFGDIIFVGSEDFINSKSITQIDTWNDTRISFNFEETINMSPTPIFSIKPYENELWVGGEDLLLFHDRNKDYWRTFGLESGIPTGKILDINIDSGYVWIASTGGLSRISRAEKKLDYAGFEYLFDNIPIYKIIDHDDHLWIGAWSGIYLYSKNSPELKRGIEIGQRYFDQKIVRVTAMREYEDSIYFVCDIGIIKYNLTSSMWDLIFNSVVYNNKTVNDIEVVGNNIFIGTVDSIVKINEKTGLVKEFNFPFIGRVNHIKIIEDNLWAGTNNGLIKFRWKASL